MYKLSRIALSFLSLTILSVVSFATGFQNPASKPLTDTIIKSVTTVDTAGTAIQPELVAKALAEKPIPVNDPKQEFKNLFETALNGDGINKARLNPMAVSFVQNYISKNKKGMLAMREWCTPHFLLMDAILTAHGVPKELKYLAVIESGLRYNAISWSGAVGPWAFMPAAARQYGLRMGNTFDERLDYFKSTNAAASLLTDMYTKYGDWLLVVAAYNCGPGNVDKAIRKAGGSKDFWTLQYYLPLESMNHVKKFIATHYIFEGEGGITTVTKGEMKDLMLNKNNSDLSNLDLLDAVTNKITGRFNSAIIIKYIDMDMATFMRYNPNFDSNISVNGTYELRLPAQKMNTFISKRYEILDESIQALLKTANTSSQ